MGTTSHSRWRKTGQSERHDTAGGVRLVAVGTTSHSRWRKTGQSERHDTTGGKTGQSERHDTAGGVQQDNQNDITQQAVYDW